VKKVTLLALFSLIALGGTLFFTRPNERDYAVYLSEQVGDRVESSLCRPEDFSTWLGKIGEALSKACEGIVSGGETLTQEDVQKIIIENTDYGNRLFFSTYITETPFGNYRAFGFFNRFIIREQTDQAADPPTNQTTEQRVSNRGFLTEGL